MIEHCTKKIMVSTIAGMIMVSVLILFLEDTFSPPTSLIAKNDFTMLLKNSSEYIRQSCTLKEKYDVVTKCTKCNEIELKASITECTSTGYRQQVRCAKAGLVWLSCSGDTADQRRHFFIFEGSVALMGIASYVMVYQRQRRLDRLLMEKVHRQIGAGV